MTSIEIVAVYAAINLLLVVLLAFRVIGSRMTNKISLGAGGNEDMERRIRSHGNAIENIPSLLIAMVILAAMAAPIWSIHLVGVLLTAGRFFHAFGLSSSVMIARQIGTVLTLTGYLAGAGLLLWQAIA